MRKRPIGQKTSNTVPSWLCKAIKESSMASMRPFMKLLEISCHGIPWVLGALVLFFCSHKPSDIEIAFNMLFALIFDLLIVGTLKMVFQRSHPSHNVMDMFIALCGQVFFPFRPYYSGSDYGLIPVF
ncbi:Phospholipid phosphatase 6 [Bulinus truncatus]|nr:Phospholipid phosphatase 6 [Bulinus truncatus]